MKKLSLFAATVVLALSVNSVNASEEIAKKNSCYACHANASKVLGPAFNEIAKRYAGQPDAAEKLAASISKGGSGKWGNIPMPAQEGLSAENSLAISKWILSLK